jgi:hypothetical protein
MMTAIMAATLPKVSKGELLLFPLSLMILFFSAKLQLVCYPTHTLAARQFQVQSRFRILILNLNYSSASFTQDVDESW